MSRPSDAEIVAELEVASSWAQGPRRERLLRFIDRMKESPAPQIPEEFGSESMKPKEKPEHGSS